MEDRENTVNVSVLILNNLRHNLRRVVEYVLGKDYYNYELDVYKSDEVMCNHLINAYEELKDRNRELKVAIGFTWAIACLLLCLLLKILMF